jgi:membrane-bound lytic murein transglycosylase B
MTRVNRLLPRFHKINQISCNVRGMKNILAPALFVLAGLAATTPASAQADFGSCLSGLRSQAAAKGISGQAFDVATRGVTPDLSILDLMNNQPEFKTAIWDYLSALVDEERV